MIRRYLLSLVALFLLAAGPAWGQVISAPGFGSTYPSFGGLQFAVAQGGIGSPSGTMTGYVLGDNITLSCTGVTFSTSPVVGVVGVTAGAVTQAAVANPGVTSGAVPAGSVACSQASTSVPVLHIR